MSETKTDQQEKYPVSPYRWVILLLIAFAAIMTNIIWVSFSPIIVQSQVFYGVGEFAIVLLAASYMIAYIPVNFPSCWALDKLGLKWGVGIGVIITGIFGFLRGIFASNFTLVVICQIMCAIGQPFILNAITKMAVMWFPLSEKAIASGLGTIASLIGAIIGVIIPEFGVFLPEDIPNLLLWYGIFCLLSMVLYLIFAREKPEQPPNPYAEKSKTLATKGTKDLFKIKDFNILLVMLFFGLGIFNTLASEIDLIFNPDIAGLISGMVIGGGVLGAIILSGVSDAIRKRKIFLVISLIAAVPFSILLAVLNVEWLVYSIGFLFGFLVVSILPIGLTYAAEITYPIQEEVSNGMLMLFGQIGGIIFLFIPPGIFMYFAAGCFLVSAVLSFLIRDTPYYEKLRNE